MTGISVWDETRYGYLRKTNHTLGGITYNNLKNITREFFVLNEGSSKANFPTQGLRSKR